MHKRMQALAMLLVLGALSAIIAGCGAGAAATPTRAPATAGASNPSATNSPAVTAAATRPAGNPASATAAATSAATAAGSLPATAKTFSSAAYGYALPYPADWAVNVQSEGTQGDAHDIERVTFAPTGGGGSLTIEAAGNAYSVTGVNCDNRYVVNPGLTGCRFSLPAAQNPAQEIVMFARGQGGSSATWSYFVLQLAYTDKRLVDTFNQMLAGFSFLAAGLPAPTPHGDAPCAYHAAFVADVSIPDHSIVKAGAGFTKTWRVRNTGTCGWGPADFLVHKLEFVGGDKLGAAASIAINATVRPGETADLSVKMTAPAKAGTYQSDWKLRVDNGPLVGVGASGSAPLSVIIVVK